VHQKSLHQIFRFMMRSPAGAQMREQRIPVKAEQLLERVTSPWLAIVCRQYHDAPMRFRKPSPGQIESHRVLLPNDP
jgi:hypothetical protein